MTKGITITGLRRDVCSLPSVAKTKGQQRLMKKHGTPLDFANACIEAIGEISLQEAIDAVSKYKREWEAAK